MTRRALLLMLLIGSCLLMAHSASVAQPPDHELSVTRLYNGEPFIAQDPTHPMSLAVAWMTYDLRARVVSITVRSSSDGGATWSDTTTLPHFGAGWGSADVSMAWSTSGTLFLSYVDYLSASTTTEGGVYVARSDNGGRTWHTPVRAIDAHANADLPIDRPWLEIDRSSGPSANTLYLCTKPAPWDPLPNHSYLTISRDSGRSWLPIKALDVAPFSAAIIKAPMGSPTVASDGTVYVAFPYAESVQNAGFALATSTDAGATFVLQPILRPQPASDTLYKNSFRLIADPSRPKHLLFTWPDVRSGDNDVYVTTSSDAGSSWASPTRVNDDPAGNGVVQDMIWPAMAFDGSGAAIVWRDRRNGGAGGYAAASDTYYSYSHDGGKSWSHSLRLTDTTAPHLASLDAPGNDFLSAVVSHDTLYATWADTRSGHLAIYFGKVALGDQAWVSIQELSPAFAKLLLWPNPAHGIVQVGLPTIGSVSGELRLLDERGVLVRRQFLSEGLHGADEAASAELSTDGLPSGHYVVEWITSRCHATAPLIVRNERKR